MSEAIIHLLDLSDDAGEAKGELEHLSVLIHREGLIMRILEHPHTPEPERVFTPGDEGELAHLPMSRVENIWMDVRRLEGYTRHIDARLSALEAQAGNGFGKAKE